MVIGILGLFVFSIGIVDMMKRDRDTDLSLLFTISFVSVIVFGALTIVKFKYSNELDSPSLYKDGICSLIGTCLSASLLLTTAIIDHAPNAWVLDPIISIIVGISAIVYGFKVILKYIKNGVPIHHVDWWYTREEDANNNQELPELPDVEKSASGEYAGKDLQLEQNGSDKEEAKSADEKDEEHEVI